MNVWCYTGFTYEVMLRNPKHKALLEHIDVLVDGKFILEQNDIKYFGLGEKSIIDIS